MVMRSALPGWVHPSAQQAPCATTGRLASTWSEAAAELREKRSVTPDIAREIKAHGLLSLGLGPKSGGAGLGWPTMSEVARIAAKQSPSVGWLLMNCAAHSLLVERMPRDARDHAFRDGPDIIVATSAAGRDVRVKDDGDGIRLAGTFVNSSGAAVADRVLLKFEHPAQGTCYAVADRHEISPLEIWNPPGLHGSGTESLLVDDVCFEPSRIVRWENCVLQENDDGAQANVQRLPLIHFLANMLTAPILGCTEGLLDEIATKVRTKVNGGVEETVSGILEKELGEAMASIDAARCAYGSILDLLDRPLTAQEAMSPDLRKLLRARSAWIAQICRVTGGQLQTLGGMSILDNEDRAQTLWRDLQVMCAHADVRARDAYSGLGRSYLTT